MNVAGGMVSLSTSCRHRGDLGHGVAGGLERVHHGIAETLPEGFVLQMLLLRVEVKVCDFDGNVFLELDERVDAAGKHKDGAKAAEDRNDQQ